MAFQLQAVLEAILFAHAEPLSKKRLAGLLDVSMEELATATEELRAALTNRGIALMEIGEELELRTSPDAADAIKKLRESELSRDIGKASLETLAFILYKGGATRGEIDWVRGVNSGAAIRSLLMRGLIERFEDEADKRRARYRATVDALAHLGVSRMEDLPRFAELSASLKEHETKVAEADAQ